MTNRRRFLQTAALGSAGLTLGASRSASARPIRDDAAARLHPIRLGVASYSLRELSRAGAIAAVKALGTPYINVKSFHLPYESTPAEIVAARKDFAEAGLTIVGGGNNNIREDTDEHVGMFFEYAKAAGIPLLVIAPTPDVLPRIETFVKRYDIPVAIHNHGPEDRYFPAPSDALTLIKDMDPRMGLCVDIGHTTRAGVDVVQEIADAGDRVLDMHVKDLRDLSERDSQCVVGEGNMPIAEIFQQLKRMEYDGYVNLEYEIDAQNPLPGMMRSFAYMRGVIAGLEGADWA